MGGCSSGDASGAVVGTGAGKLWQQYTGGGSGWASSLYCQVLSKECGSSPGDPILNQISDYGKDAAKTGAIDGFEGGELFGAETFGASGLVGAGIGATVGFAVGGGYGALRGTGTALTCAFVMHAYPRCDR